MLFINYLLLSDVVECKRNVRTVLSSSDAISPPGGWWSSIGSSKLFIDRVSSLFWASVGRSWLGGSPVDSPSGLGASNKRM
jgi:hypothetical protein